MNRKTLILLLPVTIVLAATVLWLTLLSPNRSSEENIVLKAADDHELTYPTTQGLIKMGDLLKEWTRGRITVQVYPLAQLGSEKETIEQTKLGAIDINRVNINPLTQTEPSLKVFSLPYLFRDAEHMHKVVDGPIGREMLEKLESSGLIGLGYYDSGQRSFYNSVKPIRSIEDLQGLKIRVQKAEIMQDLVRAVGAEPIRLAFEEVYTGLQTGVIHGAENNYPSWITKGHYEVAKYYSMDSHVRTPEIILFSKKTWDRLSEEDQQLIRRAAQESVPYQRKLWREKVEAAIHKAREAGCEVITDIDISSFRDAMEPVYSIHGKNLNEYIERIRAVE
ncbi:MAG: TRAP transporter substrate-binding protein [Spirochaetia bacterium]|nr:TRAP transporter substrate-binding protein [Spirochaetia bacterium]